MHKTSNLIPKARKWEYQNLATGMVQSYFLTNNCIYDQDTNWSGPKKFQRYKPKILYNLSLSCFQGFWWTLPQPCIDLTLMGGQSEEKSARTGENMLKKYK